jgi:WD40 repeat protein
MRGVAASDEDDDGDDDYEDVYATNGGEACAAVCSEQPFDVAFAPTTHVFAVGLINGDVEQWTHTDVSCAKLETLRGVHRNRETCRTLAYIDGGRTLLSGGGDMCVVATDVATGTAIARLENAHSAPVNRLISVKECVVATGDDDGVIKIWDTRAKAACGEHKPFVDFVSDMKYTNDDVNEIVISSGDGTLGCLNLTANKMVGQCDNLEDELLSVEIMKNGRKVVAGSQEGILDIFTYGKWDDISDRYPGHPQSVDAIAKMTEDMCVTGSSDGLIRVISIFPNKILGLVGEHSDMPIERLTMSFDKNMLASSSHDKTVKLWKVDWLTEEGAWEENDDMDIASAEEDSDGDDSDGGGKSKKRKAKGKKTKKPTDLKGENKKKTLTKFFDDL